jgi:glutamate carboxypeptidase
LGLEIEEGVSGGGSDGNITSLHCATLDGLGPVGDGAHAVHEHVVVPSLPDRAALLALLLLEPSLDRDPSEDVERSLAELGPEVAAIGPDPTDRGPAAV